MGYETDYYGTIKLSKKGVKLLSEKYKKDEYLGEEFDIDGINFDDDLGEINISDCGKVYENELEKFCLFLAILDKKCSGVLTCSGEDKDDFWRIIIDNGEVLIEQGYIEYKRDYKFEDTDIKKKVYKITKDKKLLKEVLVKSL